MATINFTDVAGFHNAIVDQYVAGDDTFNFSGLAGNDTLHVSGHGNVVANGGLGNDMIDGRFCGSLDAQGGAGADTILGGHGDDHLNGGFGQDYLNGGGGQNVLNGGPGRDYIDVSKGCGDTVEIFKYATVYDHSSGFNVDTVKGANCSTDFDFGAGWGTQANSLTWDTNTANVYDSHNNWVSHLVGAEGQDFQFNLGVDGHLHGMLMA